VVLAAPAVLAELAPLTGAIDELLPTPGLTPLTWHREPPAVAVNLHGRGPQSISALLALQPAMMLTYHHEQHPGIAGPAWRADAHEVDRWCSLLHWAGIDCRADDLKIDRPEGYPDHTDVVVIHPGAGSRARQWPPQRFAAVAAALSEEGMRVVITGSATERDLVEQVAAEAGLGESAVWPATEDLLALVALVHDCRLVVCGDTGVGHLATATGTPSVLLFGPTPPKHWGPREDDRHVALWAGDCGDPHADVPDPGLLLITAPRVIDAARDTLARCA
jgi:ADP-heptose:LPS heptosyltransferase